MVKKIPSGWYEEDPFGSTFSDKAPIYWKTIESAPRDGTPFLAFEHEEGFPLDQNDIEIFYWTENLKRFESWYSHYSFTLEDEAYWMPLPTIPKIETERIK